MSFNSMDLMSVCSVKVLPIYNLSAGTYVRHLLITDTDGNEMDISIHADDKSLLNVEVSDGQ